MSQKQFNEVLYEANDNYSTLIDEVDANTTYIGVAKIGTLTTASKWQIQKIVISGTVTSILWAGGSDSFTNVWGDRVSYSFS